MAYVALPQATREARLAGAAARWNAVLLAAPDLAPAVELQRRLVARLVLLTDTLDHGKLPRLSLPPKYLAAKLGRGVPALTGEPVPLPVAVLKPALLQLCGDMANGGAPEAARHIRTLLDETRIDAGSLLAASLARDQQAIRAAAVHHDLSPDLLWLLAELAVSPFANALQRMLFAQSDPRGDLSGALDRWAMGYCPACGSWPALAEAVDGRRVLRCSFCAFAWELDTHACVYCAEEGANFVTATPNPERPDRRLDVCRSCGGYLKTVGVTDFSVFPLLAITDLETMRLDMEAVEHGYSRPALKEHSRRP